ncbi:uncharacterized protein ELE39_000469 [Cryptosporidium sp. chipmunk genotype I]|uniref:uncharacterized protein n=1 Tax=Cryptosporidium sp. chipmunk genotype I TaxID=1280935 RepID=UPI00351AA0FC|nr:hypothetical protein ELE39_000469 [Cryptosporidium sp. chipmunk genotype I]
MRFKIKVSEFLKQILFQKSSWRIKTILVLMIFKSIEGNGIENLVTQNIANNKSNVGIKYLKENQNSGDLYNYNLTMLIKQEEDSDSNGDRNYNKGFGEIVRSKGLLGLGNGVLNDTIQTESSLILNPEFALSHENILNMTDCKNNTIYQPLNIRRMAEYELIHRDQIVFRPISYHQFDVIPQVIHQIPQNQYPMFRSGYLGYPYNPINYYRSPYITTVKKNNTRRILSEDLDSIMQNGYKVEYEIMEFLNGNNNSIFNH